MAAGGLSSNEAILAVLKSRIAAAKTIGKWNDRWASSARVLKFYFCYDGVMTEKHAVVTKKITRFFLRSKELALLSVLCFRNRPSPDVGSLIDAMWEIIYREVNSNSAHDLIADAEKNMRNMFDTHDIDGGSKFLRGFFEKKMQSSSINPESGESYGIHLVTVSMLVNNPGPGFTVHNSLGWSNEATKESEKLTNDLLFGGFGASLHILDGTFSCDDMESIGLKNYRLIFNEFIESIQNNLSNSTTVSALPRSSVVLNGSSLMHRICVLLTQGESESKAMGRLNDDKHINGNRWMNEFSRLFENSISNPVIVETNFPLLFSDGLRASRIIKNDINFKRSVTKQMVVAGTIGSNSTFKEVGQGPLGSALFHVYDQFGSVVAKEFYESAKDDILENCTQRAEASLLSIGCQKSTGNTIIHDFSLLVH